LSSVTLVPVPITKAIWFIFAVSTGGNTACIKAHISYHVLNLKIVMQQLFQEFWNHLIYHTFIMYAPFSVKLILFFYEVIHKYYEYVKVKVKVKLFLCFN
jgi:hypothetical protein